MHQTGSDLNIVLTYPENLSTSNSIQGHHCVSKTDPQFFTLREIPYERKVHIYHSGTSNNYRSTDGGGLIAGGTSDRRRRQACFLSAMDPLEVPLPDFTEIPRYVRYTHSEDQILMWCTHLT